MSEEHKMTQKDKLVLGITLAAIFGGVFILGLIGLIINLFHTITKLLTLRISIFFSIFTDKKRLNKLFMESFYYAQIPYTLNIFFNKKFKYLISKQDWKL